MSSKTYNPKLALLIIGKILSDGKVFPKVASILNKESLLSSPSAIHFWRAFTYLDDQEIEITEETVINYFSQREMLENINSFGVDGIPKVDSTTRGRELILRLSEYAKDEPSDVESLAKQAVKIYQNVKLMEMQNEFDRLMDENKDPDEILAFVELESSKIFGLSPKATGRIRDTKTATKIFQETLKKIMSGELKYFIKTGIKAIDFVLGGIIKKGVIIIAGTSGDGKSTLLHNIIRNTSIKGNIKAGLITGEMSEFEVISRLIQMDTGVIAKDIKQGKIPENKSEEFNKALKKIHDNGNIFFHEFNRMSMLELRASMMKMSELGCEWVGIDQANNLALEQGEGGNYLDTDLKGYLIKAWAGEFNLGVILAHQLNKGVNSVHRKGAFDVSLSDLAESGEKPADGVMFIRHDHEKTLIMHEKTRDGDLSKGKNMLVAFDPLTMVYSDHQVGLEYIPSEWQSEDK